MKVLVACEFSGVVREAFRDLGHDAYSCDILPSEESSPYHIQEDVTKISLSDYDLMIAHPPCTYLSVSGARWLYDSRYPHRRHQKKLAEDFFMFLYNAEVPRICCENPVSMIATSFRKPDQYIHPYMFGDPVSKKTGLWLKNLPLLTPTDVVSPLKATTSSGGVYDAWWLKSSSIPIKDRSKFRSKTFPGIAKAMAAQWGTL